MFDIFAEKTLQLNFFLNAIWRRRYMIMVFALIGLIASIILAIKSERYTTYTTILIQDTKVLNPVLRDYQENPTLRHRVDALRTLLHSRQLLSKAAEMIGLYDENTSEEDKVEVLRELSTQVKMRLIGNDLITLTYWSYDSKDITRTLDVITRLFIVNILYPRNTSARDTEKFLMERLNETRKSIREYEAQLAKLKGSDQVIQDSASQEIGKLQSNLAALRMRYTENHNAVLATQRAIRILQTNNSTPLQLETAKIGNLPEHFSGIDELENRITTKRSIYDNLLGRYERMQMSRELMNFEASERVQIIDQASTPLTPNNHPIWLFILAGIIMGLGIGTALSLAFEILDTSVKSRSSLERMTGVPVITRIPLIGESRQ